MRGHGLSPGKTCLAAGIGVSGAYVACVLLDLLVPSLGMTSSRFLPIPTLPLFTPRTFPIGLAGSFLSGVFFAAVIAPLYNAYFFIRDHLEEQGAVHHGDRLRYF